jgi:hypothetical protein
MIKNLTPHAIVLVLPTQTITIPPSGSVARLVSSAPSVIPPLVENGVEIPVAPPPYFESCEGLEHGGADALIVSAMVGNFFAENWSEYPHLKGRVFGPDTSPSGSVRDADGKIIGVKGLIRYF